MMLLLLLSGVSLQNLLFTNCLLMVLFLSVLDWSGLESLGRFADPPRCVIYKSNRNRVIRQGSAGRLSVLSSRERKRLTALDASLLHTFSWLSGSVFIRENSGYFPC